MWHMYGRIGTIRRIRNFETLTILRVEKNNHYKEKWDRDKIERGIRE